jgi:hypothetical protein
LPWWCSEGKQPWNISPPGAGRGIIQKKHKKVKNMNEKKKERKYSRQAIELQLLRQDGLTLHKSCKPFIHLLRENRWAPEEW